MSSSEPQDQGAAWHTSSPRRESPRRHGPGDDEAGTPRRGMKTVVLFQGGGPLGAFGCGAWRAIAPWMKAHRHRLVALAGTSIGALNAALVRQHLDDEDGGAGALTRVWRDRIATPSLPFLGLPVGRSPMAAELRSWNGFLTGLLHGNGLFTPRYAAWTPWGLMRRLHEPLFDRARMRRLMDDELVPYRSAAADDVLLAAFSVDVARGMLVLHDSDTTALGPLQVAASASLPALFDPVQIGDSLHWDGELARESPITPLLRTLRQSGRVGSDEYVQLVTVEQMPQPFVKPPVTGPEVAYRALNLTQVGKLAPSPDDGARWIRVARAALPFDGISGIFDHSPERIDTLIALGEEAAADALAAGPTVLMDDLTSPAAAHEVIG